MEITLSLKVLNSLKDTEADYEGKDCKGDGKSHPWVSKSTSSGTSGSCKQACRHTGNVQQKGLGCRAEASSQKQGQQHSSCTKISCKRFVINPSVSAIQTTLKMNLDPKINSVSNYSRGDERSRSSVFS